MNRSFAKNITRPHETLQISGMGGFRIWKGVMAWNVIILIGTVGCVILYIFAVSGATAKGYALREKEHAVEQLKTEAMIWEGKVMKLSSMEAVSERARAIGMEPVTEVHFLK